MLRQALAGTRRTAPVELVNVPPDAARFIEADGTIAIGAAITAYAQGKIAALG